MWELDHKEGWVLKNWCLWIVVLKRLLRVPWTMRESIPSKLMRSLVSLGRREGSGALEEEIGVWNSQGEGKDKCLYFSFTFFSLGHIKSFFSFFLSPELILTQQTTQFKLCNKDNTTTMYIENIQQYTYNNNVYLRIVSPSWKPSD